MKGEIGMFAEIGFMGLEGRPHVLWGLLEVWDGCPWWYGVVGSIRQYSRLGTLLCTNSALRNWNKGAYAENSGRKNVQTSLDDLQR